MPEPQPNGPALIPKDPMAIHRRSPGPAAAPNPFAAGAHFPTIPPLADRDYPDVAGPSVVRAKRAALPSSEEDDERAVPADADESACMDVCGMHRVEGAHNEHEALCSAGGLQATREYTLGLVGWMRGRRTDE